MDRAPRRTVRLSCPPAVPSLAVPRPPSRAAFSLVEVLVALTIVGILAAISVPKMTTIGNQNRVLRAAQALQMDAQQAFAVAGRNRSPVTLRWDATTAELRLTSLNGSVVYRRRAITGFGLTASEVTVSPAIFTVFPNGLAKDSLIITVARSPHSRAVHVSRAGLVRIK